MLVPLLCAAALAATQLQATTTQLSLRGTPRAIYAADATGDRVLDGLVVLDRGGTRTVAVIDGASVGVKREQLRVYEIDIPDDASFFGVCPRRGQGLFVMRGSAGLYRVGLDASTEQVQSLADALPLVETGDMPLVDICPGADGQRLLIPTLRGVSEINFDGAPRHYDVPRRAYLTSGVKFRGPRARRDFALMSTLVHPRLFVGEIDGDAKLDLAAAVEEEIAIYPAAGEPSRQVLSIRTERQRRDQVGSVETQLADLNGDGLLDALVSYQRGGSDSMRTVWKLYPGPLGAKPREAVASQGRKGLATPLLIADVDLDGKLELFEPHVDTGIISMGRALVTGHIAVRYRVHRLSKLGRSSAKAMEIAHDIDFSRSTNIAGHPPLLGGDFDGDGRGDLIALGSSDEVALHLGRDADPPFESRPTVTAKVPATQRAVSLRRARSGPASVLFVDESGGRARLTAVTFAAPTAARSRARGR